MVGSDTGKPSVRAEAPRPLPPGEAAPPRARPPIAPHRRRAGWWRRLAHAYGVDDLRRYDAAILVLAVGTIASYVGRGAAIPFVVEYLASNHIIALGFVSVGIAIEQGTRALLSPLFGGLSDRFGRKPFMILGLLMQAVTIPAYVLVSGPSSYLAVSLLAGLGQAPYQPALSAFIADIAPRDQRVGAFGLVHMTKNLGWTVGIALGGLLVHAGHVLLFVTGGLFPLLFAGILAVRVREKRAEREERARVHPLRSATAALRNPTFVAFLFAATGVFLAWGQMDTVFPFFITSGLGLGHSWITAAFLVNGLLIIAFQVPVSRRVGEWSRTRGLAVAGIMGALGFLALAAVVAVLHDNPAAARAGLLGGMALITIAEMVNTPLIFSLAAELAPRQMVGGAMGVLALAAPIGLAAPPIIADAIRVTWGWGWVWMAFGGILALDALMFLGVPRARADASATTADASPAQ